jgi:diguanylate cyclase (GGDEF)-like protein
MISIRKYLYANNEVPPAPEPEMDGLTATTIGCYRASLLAIGRAAIQICPALGLDLESSLRGLERRLAVDYTAESVMRTEKQVEVQLDEWGARTETHFKGMADEVKELLLALAKTAESVGTRDQGYSSKFNDLTGRLEQIARLDDLTQIRVSLVERVKELKTSVEQMTAENRQLVAQLRAEVSTYETRLKSAEHLALKDPLTNVANRRSLEERIQWNIENRQEFCLVLLDLNNFKHVNDTYGHVAGDDLLKQFAAELQLNTRSGDLVGRWGGDEFMVVLTCSLESAKAHIERVQKWVFGKYTLHGPGQRAIQLEIDASIGAAEFRQGLSLRQMVSEADAAMYANKKLADKKAS